MDSLIIGAIMRLIGLTVRRSPRKTARGIEGRIGWLLVVLPVVVVRILLGAAVNQVEAPGIEKLISAIPFILAALFVVVSVYFLTFRLTLEGSILRSSSAVTRVSSIELMEPFSVEYAEDDKTLEVLQGETGISINWMMSGHRVFFKRITSFASRTKNAPLP
jgi:hypothetical protein